MMTVFPKVHNSSRNRISAKNALEALHSFIGGVCQADVIFLSLNLFH